MNEIMKNRMLTPAASEYMGIASSTLRRMQVSGTGPKYYLVGKRYNYTPSDIDAFIESCVVNPTA